ncbi:MAG: hypothetical protein KDF24_09170, partial [Rhodocyclaceae bacterium]|nr:hypothetical protein [Rhodocyclaceae bacterium]
MLWIKDSMRGWVTQKRRHGAGVLWVGEACAQSRLREVPEALRGRRGAEPSRLGCRSAPSRAG